MIGNTGRFLVNGALMAGAVSWQMAKLSGRQLWRGVPGNRAISRVFERTVETGGQILKMTPSVLVGTAAYKSGYVGPTISKVGEILTPVLEPVGAYASDAKAAVKGYVVQTLADAASAGLSGIVHFIARRIFSAVTSIFDALGLFFQIFKQMDTSAQIMVGGALLLRFTGPKLQKKMHTFCVGPDLPYVANRGASRSQSPLSALIRKGLNRFPWMKGKEEMKPVLNKDVREIVEPFIAANKEIAAGGSGFFRNMLFLGSPGTGKTMLAKYIAKESGMNYIEIDGGTFAALEQWQQGQALKALKNLLEYIEQSGRPVLVLIDEADGLLPRPDDTRYFRTMRDPRAPQVEDWKVQFRSTLLAATSVSNKLGLVLTTNHPDKMDRALLSRISMKINITPPDLDSRTEILTKYINQHFEKRPERTGCLSDENIKELAKQTEGMSGRDLLFLVDSFVVGQKASRDKILTPEMVASMLDLSVRSYKEEYAYNAAKAEEAVLEQKTAEVKVDVPAPVQAVELVPTQTPVSVQTPEPTQTPLSVETLAPTETLASAQTAEPTETLESTQAPAVKTVESLSQKISSYVARVFSQIMQMFSGFFSAIGRLFSFSRAKSTVPIPTPVLGPVASATVPLSKGEG